MELFAAFINRAIMQGTPLLFGATGEIVTEKSGNLNLGIPGIMYIGAISGVIGAFFYENSPIFIPAVGEFMIPELLGGPDNLLIGRVLWQEFFNNRDWPLASAVATTMLLLLVLPMLLFQRSQNEELKGEKK